MIWSVRVLLAVLALLGATPQHAADPLDCQIFNFNWIAPKLAVSI